MEFQNRRGEPLPAFTATVAKNEFGRVLDAAVEHGAVAITRHDTARAVLLSIEEYRSLLGARDLDILTDEFDALLGSMQSPASRRGARAAFAASPVQLGKAAVKAARKRG